MSRKNQEKPPRRNSAFWAVLKIITLLLCLWYACAMPVLSGAGLIRNRLSYGEEITKTGIFLIAAAAMMTAGTILCFFRRSLCDILSAVFSGTGFILCMTMLKKLTDHADSFGWTDKYTLHPISGMYTGRILPCALPAVLTVIIAAVHFMSYEAMEQRRLKKAAAEAEKNAPAPSVTDDVP